MPTPPRSRITASIIAIVPIVLMLTSGCAYKVAPTGGPRDTIPAAVVIVEPPSGTTNFSSNEIRIVYDDYIDRGIRNSITVLPTKRFTTTYAGDEITIAFREPLDSSTTYSVTIGTDWTDIRSNRPLEAFSYVFSTGSAIDSGSIRGNVIASNLQNIVVMCFPNADTLPADWSPLASKAPYIIPVGTSGSFVLRGLATKRYRVLACKDDNKNGMLDANEDFAMATQDVQVPMATSNIVTLRMGRARDHEPPQIARLRAVSNSLLSVQFTEPITPVVSWDSALALISQRGQRIRPQAVWTSADAQDLVLMRFAKPLDSATYSLQLAPKSVRDSAGTVSADSVTVRSLQWTTRQDTTRLRITKIIPPDSARDVVQDTTIRIMFSDAVDTNDVRVSIWHQQPQGAVPVIVHWHSPVELEIRAAQPRTQKTWYATTIVPDQLHSFVDSSISTDTVFHAMLTSARKTDPGTVRGVIKGLAPPPADVQAILRLVSSQGSVMITTPVDSGGRFVLENAPAGEFAADVFYDINKNDIYDYGDWRPFRFSEPWWQVRTKILVRSRWTLDDVVLSVSP